MDQIKFGKFLSSLRNEKQLTQEQLAEKLHVGSKTISKWECGNTLPDFEMLISISKEFDISLYELSECEKIPKTKIKKEELLKVIDKAHLKKISRKKRLIFITIILLIIISLASILYTITNFNTTKVYTIESLNESFEVHGSYTKTKNYSVFSITKVAYIGDDYDLIENKISNYDYEIFNKNIRIYSYAQNKSDDTNLDANNLFSKINILIDSNTHSTQAINENDNLTLTISYLDKKQKNENNIININLKLVENFVNNQIL